MNAHWMIHAAYFFGGMVVMLAAIGLGYVAAMLELAAEVHAEEEHNRAEAWP